MCLLLLINKIDFYWFFYFLLQVYYLPQ
jgi:hypothetical protein